MAGTLPPRTGDTMGMAIAMSSPSGRMSQTARTRATDALGKALFGDWTPDPLPPQPTRAESLRREAAQCRELAARGFRPRAGIKQAEWCEAEADRLEPRSYAETHTGLEG
jgi:hypothetical protein